MMVRILVVDDESDVEMLFRQQFRRELREGRFALEIAASAHATLETLTSGTGRLRFPHEADRLR